MPDGVLQRTDAIINSRITIAGIASGGVIGAAIGVALGNVATGIGIGIALGIAMSLGKEAADRRNN